MPGPRHARLVGVAVRCYPARWRTRHGDEAKELAELLVRDGVPAASVVWSYVRGAAREQLVAAPSHRLGRTAALLLVGAALIGVPLMLVDSSTPANASGNEVIAGISIRNDAAAQLKAVFEAHHFNIEVEEEPSSPERVGSILAIRATGRAALREIPGPCVGGASGALTRSRCRFATRAQRRSSLGVAQSLVKRIFGYRAPWVLAKTSRCDGISC
jgi:hypothetical protein